jgi:hypothetical protein
MKPSCVAGALLTSVLAGPAMAADLSAKDLSAKDLSAEPPVHAAPFGSAQR